jgi:hypothetical protein
MKKLESLKLAFCGAALFRFLAAGVFVICGIAAAQERSTGPAVGYEDSYQINVVGRLDLADSVVNITNPGFHVPPSPIPGGLPTSAGYICANVYVFDPSERMQECCSCPVSRNGVNHLSAKNDLTSNTISGVALTSVTIKLVATIPPGGVDSPRCDPTKLPAATVALGANGGFASGMRAWATHVHSVAASAGGPLQFATETEFSQVPLSDPERVVLGTTCRVIFGNASGVGLCAVCHTGAQ